MPVVIIDGREVEIGPGEKLNGIEVAARAGIEIPHYCWHPGLSVVASCRMCLVETGRRDAQTGEVQMLPKLVPACQTPATDGTIFVTDSDKVRQARAMVEEDLLLRHPVDCPICDKAGECRLQDYYFDYGTERRRADIKPFHSRKRELGPTVRLFVDRCVMCTRCVRFCREVAETSELYVQNRGAHEEIEVFPGFPLENPLAGNVVDLCPVGALADKDFLYRQRVWYMRSRPHVCPGCASGCSIWVDQNQDRIYRIRPRENREVNGWWICDAGRYGWKHVHDSRRLTQPIRRDEANEWQSADWSRLLPELDERFRAAERPTLVLSPFLTLEEAYLALEYFRGLPGSSRIVIGPVPEEDGERTFAGGFTIAAQKCPNRRGIGELAEAVLGALPSSWRDWMVSGVDGDAVWVSGGYPDEVFAEQDAAALEAVGLLVVHDLFRHPVAGRADVRLPAVAGLERQGSYVNRAGRLQSFTPAVRPPAGCRSAGQVFWQLCGRRGLFQSDEVLTEIAEEFPVFAAARPPIGDTGVSLVEQLGRETEVAS